MRIIPMNMFSGRSSPSKAMRHGAEFLFVAVTTGSEFAKLANAREMMQTCLLFELFHMVKHRTKNSVPSQTLLKATDVWLPTKPHGETDGLQKAGFLLAWWVWQTNGFNWKM